MIHARAVRAEYDEHRASASVRGYGRRWRKLRLMVLRRQPICQWPRCRRSSTEVDHIVPKRRGGLDTMANLQGLCKTHHSRKTAAERMGRGGVIAPENGA